ncbi:uncharacterized protein LOC143582975 [Bidens hawaiensis]|uniref:uncharacterized protein LOC143582975 n=1 Tax=Bidens hawaiensis TaxID=980011 RepID=UPI0040497DEF
MGLCTSCYSGNTTTATTTVKLILFNGQLREFTSPVKVFLLNDGVCFFICNSDEMDFDKYVTAMCGESELLPGQLYFELPASWLNRRLTAEDMAALAVKAGAALMVSGGKVGCGCWVKRVDPLVFCEDGDDEMTSSSWSRVGGSGDGGGCHRGDGGKGRRFVRLERIAEE